MRKPLHEERERSILPRNRARCIVSPARFWKRIPRIARVSGSGGVDRHAHLFLSSQPPDFLLSRQTKSYDRPAQSHFSASTPSPQKTALRRVRSREFGLVSFARIRSGFVRANSVWVRSREFGLGSFARIRSGFARAISVWVRSRDFGLGSFARFWSGFVRAILCWVSHSKWKSSSCTRWRKNAPRALRHEPGFARFVKITKEREMTRKEEKRRERRRSSGGAHGLCRDVYTNISHGYGYEK
jgi:hypothetical protein